ncbi:MAG: hypothetical protein JO013_11070 [Alphaproteobacteria bacterium]|nr:hypothetical protein [Alphaproteobacteria bacterium]
MAAVRRATSYATSLAAAAILLLGGLPARAVPPARAGRSHRSPGAAPLAPYPTAWEIGDNLAEIYNGMLRARNCGDTGPACPAMPPPDVSAVSCAGDADPVATCTFDVRQYGALEHCTARFERRPAGWWLVRDNSSYFAPPILDMACTPKSR